MTEWIKCSDRMPEECANVLVWSKGMTPISAYLIYAERGKPICFYVNDWDESDQEINLKDVTHWMELPEEPK